MFLQDPKLDFKSNVWGEIEAAAYGRLWPGIEI